MHRNLPDIVSKQSPDCDHAHKANDPEIIQECVHFFFTNLNAGFFFLLREIFVLVIKIFVGLDLILGQTLILVQIWDIDWFDSCHLVKISFDI
jgi:hypothetical protein